MCLYTEWILNPKYLKSKKNNYNAPEIKDERTRYIPKACGECIECKKAKAREWKVRLLEEIKHDKTGKFITLTFNDESIKELEIIGETKEANKIATIAVRRFLERWRKKYKKSIKHWFITELGHKNTERIHLHGIIFTKENKEEIEKIWKYGRIDIGYSMGDKCINYIMKYVTKEDKDHKGYRGKILTSKGIGSKYIETYNAKRNKYKGEKTKETYKLNNGGETKLPMYYRNKIYSEEEREKLWLQKLDKNEIYILGRKIDTRNKNEVDEAIKYARRLNKAKGYGEGKGKKEYLAKNNKTNLDYWENSDTLAEYLKNKYKSKKSKL